MDADKSSVSKNNSYSCFLIFCSIRNLDEKSKDKFLDDVQYLLTSINLVTNIIVDICTKVRDYENCYRL